MGWRLRRLRCVDIEIRVIDSAAQNDLGCLTNLVQWPRIVRVVKWLLNAKLLQDSGTQGVGEATNKGMQCLVLGQVFFCDEELGYGHELAKILAETLFS